MRQRAPAVVAATVALALAAGAVTSAAAPIPSDPKPADVEPFQGAAAKPRRLAAKEPPRHPHMAPNGRSSLHNDDYDLTGAVPAGDEIISALPDWLGRYRFASINEVMGTVDPASGAVRSIPLGEDISNSFAVERRR